MSDDDFPDTVFLRELRVQTVIGIWDWERQLPQTVSIDLEMGGDVAKAALTDRIEDTLNYKAVAKRVQQFVAESNFQLVETLAERIAEVVLSEFELPWIVVQVSKPGAIRGAKNVGVRIRRSRAAT